MDRFHDTPLLRQIADNLYHGWGYNFYRAENQLRADNLLIRQKVSWLLGCARETVEAALASFRRVHLPPPTRARPRPDPDAIARAAIIQDLAAAIGRLEGAVRALPVPENDRMTERFRKERETLARLCEFDAILVGRAGLLREDLAGKDSAWVLDHAGELRAAIAVMQEGVQARQGLLHDPDKITGFPSR
jgi:hypothetical protein